MRYQIVFEGEYDGDVSVEPRIQSLVREFQQDIRHAGLKGKARVRLAGGALPERIFASEEAFQLADEKGLTARDFAGVNASGKTGYTKADVEALIEE